MPLLLIIVLLYILACIIIGQNIYGERGALLGLFFNIFGVIVASILSLSPDYQREARYIRARAVEDKYNEALEKRESIKLAKERQNKEIEAFENSLKNKG